VVNTQELSWRLTAALWSASMALGLPPVTVEAWWSSGLPNAQCQTIRPRDSIIKPTERVAAHPIVDCDEQR